MASLFSQKFDPSKDLLELMGKVVIVTGGNRGIGYSTVKLLARRGAKVYLTARDESKASEALSSLEAEGLGTGSVEWLKLDLLDPRATKKAAEEFLNKESRLDVLVNNAAMLANNIFEKTADGISESMATNYIGPFVFVRTVLPLLVETSRLPNSDVRIVNLTSKALLYVPKVRFRNLDDLNLEYKHTLLPGLRRYAHSKLTNLLFTKELQRRLDADGNSIVVIALHPGSVNTYSHEIPLPPKIAHWLLGLIATSPDVGAWTSVFAAASPLVRGDPKKYKGAFLMPVGQLSNGPKQSEDPELGRELWSTTETFLEEIGV